MAGACVKEVSKVFFSEEKKNKTFASFGGGAASESRDSVEEKFIGSFFQKRTPFFLCLVTEPVC